MNEIRVERIIKSSIQREIIFSILAPAFLAILMNYIKDLQAGMVTWLVGSLVMLWSLWEEANEFHFSDEGLIVINRISRKSREIGYSEIEKVTFRTNKRVPMLEVMV